MIRRPPRSTQSRSSAASDVYKRQAPERERLTRLRRPDQDVVLGAWEMIFALSADESDAAVDAALAGYAERDVRYLSLFGIDPGPDYADWLMSPIAGAVVE